MKKGLSIVLCTFNGKKRLDATLKRLAKQLISIPCEVILVDNASDDGTNIFADSWWKKYGNPKIAYRAFKEPIPGKSYAQDLGYAKAQYEYILVCDDDNWLCNTYVQTAYDIMESNSDIGALGGWCDAAFEKEKPEWFDTNARFFAVSKQGIESGDITYHKGCLYGAGMVIRKSHWLELKDKGFNHILTCRKGDSLSSGGDTEYSYALRLLGYKIWYDERLYFQHFMTSGRLHLEYLSRLRKAMSYSNFMLLSYLDVLRGENQTAIDFLKSAFKDAPKRHVKALWYFFVGDYDQKENAKKYFRSLYYLLFCYGRYKRVKTSILHWLNK